MSFKCIETVKLSTLIEAAQSLASEHGENPEYDRALLELIANTMTGNRSEDREYLSRLIFGNRNFGPW